MATSNPVTLFNTDPNVQAQAALIAQRQAMAQALLKEGMTPIDTKDRSIGGVAYHISPFEGLAKLLQTYSGQEGVQSAVGDQAKLAAQAYGNLLGKYQPGETPSYSSPQIAGAEQGGMAADGYGPPDPQKVAKALMGQQPAQGGVNPNNPQGIPAQILAAHDAGMMNDETFKALTAPYAPTDATKSATQGGTNVQLANRQAFDKTVTDPKIYAMRQAGFTPEQIYAAQYGEAAKAAEIDRKGGNQFVNPLLGQSGTVPKLPDYANPTGAPRGDGSIPGVTPIPGAPQVVQGNAGASATGTTSGTLHSVTLPGGRVAPVRGSEIGPGGTLNSDGDRTAIYQGEFAKATQRLVQLQSMPNADPKMIAAAQADVNGLKREMGRYNIPLGQGTADTELQKDAGTAMANLPQQITQTKQTITGLENGLRVLSELNKAGPGVSKTVNAVAMLNNMGVPLLKGDVNGYQTLKKYLENSAASAAAAGGFTGSDARFEQFKAGQPNAETMNPKALEGAIRYVLSQQDAALHQGNVLLKQSGGDASRLPAARQQWAQQYNPRYFELQRLAPAEQATAVQQMSPQDAAAFLAWRKAQKGN